MLRCGADVSILQEFDQIDFNEIKKVGEDRWRRGNGKSATSSSARRQDSSSSSSSFHCVREEEEEEEGEEALGNILFAFVPGYWQAVATSDIAAVRKLVNSW